MCVRPHVWRRCRPISTSSCTEPDLRTRALFPQEAYLFQAALAELKTGSQVKLRNDSITLRSLTANLQRETDGLEQKMKEDMQRLSSDIQVRARDVVATFERFNA